MFKLGAVGVGGSGGVIPSVLDATTGSYDISVTA